MTENISEIRKKWFINQIEKLHSDGISYAEIADKLEVKPQFLNNIIKGDRGASEKFVAKFCLIFDINQNDLFDSFKGNNSDVIYKKDNTEQITIPLIPIDAAAGFGKGDISVMETDLMEQYVIPDFTTKGVKFLIRVSGSSMYPKYSNGDILACRPITDITFFQWGKVYVLDTDQGALVKRLFEGKSDEYVECRSDNKDHYPPFQLPKTSIRSISIVVGVVRLD